MGASNSKEEEDKALKLCRERKKFVKQALDGRCSLAAAHFMYIQSLKNTGTALRKFVEPGAPIESSLHTSTNATPEPLVQIEKSLSQFSYSSPSVSQRINATDNFTPPSPNSTLFQANHMKVRGSFSKKVEEIPPVSVTETVTSLSTPQNTSPRSAEKPEISPFRASSLPPETPPWDYFGFFHPIDDQFSFQDGKDNQGLESTDNLKRLGEEGGIPDLENEGEKTSFRGREESQDSDDEFEEPTADTLVRQFENLNRAHDHIEASASPTVPPAESLTSETELLNEEKGNSPGLSPLRTTSPVVELESDSNETTLKEDYMESKVAPKDFVSSIKDIDSLFIKAFDSGKEIPKMLEANKFHFRPISQAKASESISSAFLKACFSCGEDPSQVQEEPPQTAVKYLTWHRTTSSRSSSSRNLLGANSKDGVEDSTGQLFDNFCMISGSHASTLDRLYAWERKLYDEVKASEMVRRDYDLKCKFLRQLESTGEHSQKVDKTRAGVKDLHSRIRIAIHRIDSISKMIEDLRDKELQPQIEELIQGLSRMWGVMLECHKLQFLIISIAYNKGNTKISINSESHRQIIYLKDELSNLSSSFMKWIGAQKFYLQSINGWLLKCVSIAEKSSKKKRRQPENPLRDCGPPIYAACGVWFDKLETLPANEVTESIKMLETEIDSFLSHQEKKEMKDAIHSGLTSWKADNDNGIDSASNMLRDESQAWISGFDGFQTSLTPVFGKLSNFAESSVKMFAEVQEAIQRSKNKYEHIKAQSVV